jgi:hypothetical protein
MRKHSASVKNRIDDNSGRCDDLASVALVGRESGPSTPAPPDSQDSQGSESNQLPTDSFQVLSKRELITLLRRRPCRFDDADLAGLASMTLQRLRVLRARACEGKSVDEASEFARWVGYSGLQKLIGGKRAAELEKLAKDTLWDCECYYRNDCRGPWVAKSELEALNAKMDNLCGVVAGLAQGLATVTRDADLAVLPDVLDEEMKGRQHA